MRGMVELSSGAGSMRSMVEMSCGAGSLRSMVEMSRGSRFHEGHGGIEHDVGEALGSRIHGEQFS
jgi:hypothetical protein